MDIITIGSGKKTLNDDTLSITIDVIGVPPPVEVVPPPVEVVPPPVGYVLTITAPLGGTTEPSSGLYTYAAGSVVSVTAFAQEGYVFDHWNLDGVNVDSSNPISVTMDANHTLEAIFMFAPLPTVPEAVPPVAPPVAPAVPPPAPAVTPETVGLIVLGVVAAVISIGATIWYFTKPS